jgi:XisH protein
MAKDIYHEHVKVALVKEGWTITAEQFSIPAGTRRVRIDLAAEKMILAERGTERIAVEIKSFLDDSIMNDFHRALGQSVVYKFALSKIEPDRRLITAIPVDAYEEILTDPFFIDLSKA